MVPAALLACFNPPLLPLFMHAHIVLGDIGRNAVSLTGAVDVIPCCIFSTQNAQYKLWWLFINAWLHTWNVHLQHCQLLPGSTVVIGAGIANNADE
jgi:hypothetical protein